MGFEILFVDDNSDNDDDVDENKKKCWYFYDFYVFSSIQFGYIFRALFHYSW